jgi:hypothetical protein
MLSKNGYGKGFGKEITFQPTQPTRRYRRTEHYLVGWGFDATKIMGEMFPTPAFFIRSGLHQESSL